MASDRSGLTRALFDLLHNPSARARLAQSQVEHPALRSIDSVELERAAGGQLADLRARLMPFFKDELAKVGPDLLVRFQASDIYVSARALPTSPSDVTVIQAFRHFLALDGAALGHGAEYHAHLYGDENELPALDTVRQKLLAAFPGIQAKLFSSPVGPHPLPFLELDFPAAILVDLRPALVLCSRKWPVLIHPVSGNDLHDHTAAAEWLGTPLPLKLEVL